MMMMQRMQILGFLLKEVCQLKRGNCPYRHASMSKIAMYALAVSNFTNL